MATNINLRDTVVVTNGTVLSGWSDDADALMLPDVDLANVTRGADGRMVAAGTGNLGGQVTKKFMANSPSAQFFMQQIAVLLRGGSVIFNTTIRNAVMGISMRLANGVLVTGPLGQTFGAGEAPAREFVFEYELIIPNYDGALFSGPPEATPTIRRPQLITV